MTLQIFLTENEDEAGRDFIHKAIKTFNNERSPHHKAIRRAGADFLNIFIRDEAGQIWGGLTARTYWGWLSVDDLWLDETIRGQGYGRKLLTIAEEQAKKRGCQHAFLRTFSFQARGFYEKNGYRVVGQLDDYPPGETIYTMRKDFS